MSAWACAGGITLAQCFVGDKSNEITAIPEVLEMLKDVQEMLDTWQDLKREWRERHPLEVDLSDYDALLDGGVDRGVDGDGWVDAAETSVLTEVEA